MSVTKTYGLTTDAGVVDLPGSVPPADFLPDQTGHNGEYLTTDGNAVSWAAVSSGGGLPYIYPNLSLTVPTGLRLKRDFLDINPNSQFLTQADSKTNPPAGWRFCQVLTNLNNLAAASVSSGILTFTGVGTANYRWDANEFSCPLFEKEVLVPNYEAIFRIQLAAGAEASQYMNWGIINNVTEGQDELDDFILFEHANDGVVYIRGGDNNAIGSANIGLTAMTNGVWWRFSKRGPYIDWSYNTTNQDTVPTTGWGSTSNVGNISEYRNRIAFGMRCLLRFGMRRNGGTAPSVNVRYFKDRVGPDFVVNDSAEWREWTCADGFGTGSNMDITITSDQAIGAGSTINDADVQAVLTKITNSRAYDAATITYSVVRSATPGATAGSYAAPASVTVAGTGTYVNIFARVSSAARTAQGSIDIANLKIPFTAA